MSSTFGSIARTASATKYQVTPLDDYFGLLGLPLADYGLSKHFKFRGATCRASNNDGHLLFEVVQDARFGLALAFPGWFIGEHTAQPVHIAVAGDAIAMIAWLPVAHENKLEIIDRLPFADDEKFLMRIAA